MHFGSADRRCWLQHLFESLPLPLPLPLPLKSCAKREMVPVDPRGLPCALLEP